MCFRCNHAVQTNYIHYSEASLSRHVRCLKQTPASMRYTIYLVRRACYIRPKANYQGVIKKQNLKQNKLREEMLYDM